MYWFILLIPLLIAWGAKVFLHATITWKEMGVQIAASVVVVAIILAAGSFSQVADTEIWNGRITDKAQVKVSCEHSYDCMCVDVPTGDKGQTMRVCQTCYDHSYDWDWRVMTSIDDFNISRVDRQGNNEPPRWTQVQVGEPYAEEKMFVNYIKAVPESIFGEISESHPLVSMVPEYPNVYDYYRVQRVQSVGVPVKDLKQWNDGLSEIARDMGFSKEVNPIIQFVKTNDPTYQFALEQKWIGGKKNDLTVIFGVSAYPKIDFVRVVAWENEKIKHLLREKLETGEILDDKYRTFALSSIKEGIAKDFKRMHMKDYEYLKDEIDPPMWVIVLGFIVALLGSLGLTYYFHQNDVFGDEGRSVYRQRATFRTFKRRPSNRRWRS